jgi:hypothetical protein
MKNRALGVLGVVVMISTACSQRMVGPMPTSVPRDSPSPPSGAGPTADRPTPIPLGARIDAIVEAGDAECFPNWDARGRCRAFEVVAAASGTLVASMIGSGPSRGMTNPEIFLIAPGGSWTWSDEGWPERHVKMAATNGVVYRIVVISYGPFPDVFALTVDMQ